MNTMQRFFILTFSLVMMTGACYAKSEHKHHQKSKVVSNEDGCLQLLRGNVCVNSVTQIGDGTPILTVGLSVNSSPDNNAGGYIAQGVGFNVTCLGVTSQDLTAAFSHAGWGTLKAALAIEIPFNVTFNKMTNDIPVVLMSPINSITSNIVSQNNSAVIISVRSTVNNGFILPNTTIGGFNANINIVALGTSQSAIWDLVYEWLLTGTANNLCANFVVLSH